MTAWGGKGVRGGAGGDGFIGYNHAFDNGVVVGVQAEAGYGPLLWATPRGFSQFSGTAYAGGVATVGYRMGQLTPYLIAGVDFARPSNFGGANPLDAVNAVFSGPGAVQAVGTVGMGATYQVTPNLSFGVEARVSKATNSDPNAWVAPFALLTRRPRLARLAFARRRATPTASSSSRLQPHPCLICPVARSSSAPPSSQARP